jgi:hypothetical protein
MTPELLDALIKAGESLSVEFKGEEHEALNDREMVEAVVCLANRPADEERGYLIIGVEDDGRLTGARPRHEAGQTDPRRVQALIANRTQPALTCRGAGVSRAGWNHRGQIPAPDRGREGTARLLPLLLPRDAGASRRSGAVGLFVARGTRCPVG